MQIQGDALHALLRLRVLLPGSIDLALKLRDRVLVPCPGLGQLGNLFLACQDLSLHIQVGVLQLLLAACELLCSAFKRFLQFVQVPQMHSLHIGSHLHRLLLQSLGDCRH